MRDKLYLRWNDYESCILNSFENLRRENDFLDVTLVSDDEIIMKAHKVVLSACSPFFRNILRYSAVNQPLMLFIDGVKSHDLRLVLDYVYQGEVKLYQENLGSFLKATEKLKISGLSERAMETRRKKSEIRNINETSINQGQGNSQGPNQTQIDSSNQNSLNHAPGPQSTGNTSDENNFTSDFTDFSLENDFINNCADNNVEKDVTDQYDFSLKTEEANLDESIPESTPVYAAGSDMNGDGEKRVVVFDFKGNTNIDLLDMKIQELIVVNDFGSKKNNSKYGCKACSRTSRDKSGISTHIETHFDGLSFICDLCTKEFKSREGIRRHKQRHANGGIARPFNVYGY